jgi:hypothetical protein
MNGMVLMYFLEAIVCASLLMYVMIKYEERERANKIDPDPPWLRLARKSSFFVAASLMIFSAAAYRVWVISIPVLLLVAAIILILAFNAISQYRRTPPDDREGVQEAIQHGYPAFGHYISKSDVMRLDAGQKHIIDLVEEVLRNQELRPDKAIVYPVQFHSKQ